MSRHCFTKSLPAHLAELPGGPRLGSITRAGFEPARDAAGHPFPEGERDSRSVLTVDGLPSKRKDPLASFDRTGAALASPRVEVRALHIDDHVRRACSEPPRQCNAPPAAQLLSMQTFGVFPGIDAQISGRRRSMSPELCPDTRDEVAKRAVRFGDITGILGKRHLPTPRGQLSPRLAATATEDVDIDVPLGRGRGRHGARRASAGILPLESTSYNFAIDNNKLTRHESLTRSPRGRSLEYFEKTLEAERYVKLIGRPHVGTEKELQRKRLALELERQERSEENSVALVAKKFPGGSRASVAGLSIMSTTASEGSATPSEPMSPASTQKTLSMASRSIFNAFEDLEADQACSVYGVEEDVETMVINEQEILYEQDMSVPLGLRRMMKALMPKETQLSEDLVDDVRTALSASVHVLGKSQSTARNRRYGGSPARRATNDRRRTGLRS